MKYFQKFSGSWWLYDCLLLTAIVVFSSVLYINRLGFYSDDWSFLGIFVNTQDQSVLGIFYSIHGNHDMRPIQSLLLAILYRTFKLDPFGYHLVNLLLITASTLVFYFLLRKLKFNNLIALTVSLVYVLLPHYSSEHFWILLIQTNFSTLFYFLSLIADLKSLESNAIIYKTIGTICLLLSLFAYETFLPMAFLSLLIIGYKIWRTREKPLMPIVWHCSITLPALAFVIWYKAVTTQRMDTNRNFGEALKENLLMFFDFGTYPGWGMNIRQALLINFYDHGLALPRVIWRILNYHFSLPVLMLSLFLSFIIFAYIYLRCRIELKLLSARQFITLIVAGFVVFWFGYAIFLLSETIQLTTTGITNRTSHAAAIGVAFISIGIFGLVNLILPRALGQICFSILIAMLCFCGCLIINTHALFWETAYEKEQQILTQFKNQFENFPTENTVFLDGICPYDGPAIVFESDWDFAGALQILYLDGKIRADVIKNNLMIRDDGVSTFMYGREKKYYYKDNLLIYNLADKRTYLIRDETGAKEYMQQRISTNACPEGRDGTGLEIY